jgi:hypothetical protein
MERKLAFYELGGGRLAQDAQDAFEEASRFATQNSLGAEVSIKIKLSAPNPQEPDFAEAYWEIGVKKDPRRSMRVTTQQIKGIIVAEGKDSTDCLQLNLDLPELGKITQSSRSVAGL